MKKKIKTYTPLLGLASLFIFVANRNSVYSLFDLVLLLAYFFASFFGSIIFLNYLEKKKMLLDEEDVG